MWLMLGTTVHVCSFSLFLFELLLCSGDSTRGVRSFVVKRGGGVFFRRFALLSFGGIGLRRGSAF